MRLRKIILTSCILASIVLFIEGLVVVGLMSADEKRSHEKYNLTRVEQTNEQREPVRANPINIVVLGLDEEEVRSDVIILLNFSPSNGKINVLSIARDTKVRARGSTEKINAMIGIGGEKLAAEKVWEITGLPVQYYVTVNFKGFRKVIDILGGVEFYVPINMDYDDPEQNLHIHLKKGTQLLNGKKAEQLVRYRKGNKRGQGYSDGDIGRIKVQQDFIKAMINQKLKLKYLSKADDIYLTLKKCTRTNIEIGDINYYFKDIKKIKYDDIKTFTLPGDSDYIDDVWYFIHDKEETKKMIDDNFFK